MPNREHLPWLSFDCYDTLVRYTENKMSRLEELIRIKGGNYDVIASAQKAFADRERALQTGTFYLLNDILRKSLATAFDIANLPCTTEDEDAIIEAVRSAPPFADVPAALSDLKRHFRLAVLSNSEPDIIRHNMIRIGVGMDAIVLASDAKCYKPASGMFDKLLFRIGSPAANVTHVAQSFYHDIRPAKNKGFGRRIWINRYGRDGDPAYTPDAELSDLSGVRNALVT
mgnify:CR=1 FL=1